MPIYEYRCKRGHTFEVMRNISDAPLSECETCSAPVERVFHPIAVHFKGSGFYNTDYGTRKRSREKESAEKESKDGASSTSSDSSASKSDGSKSDGSKSDGSKSDSGAAKSESKSSKTEAKAS